VSSLQNQAKETFPGKRKPFLQIVLWNKFPPYSLLKKTNVKVRLGAQCIQHLRMFDYFLCLLLCKLIKSFVCAQCNIDKCFSAILGPYFKELPSPFTKFEVSTVALLSIQVLWKVTLCCVSDCCAIKTSGTAQKCQDVTFQWNCMRMLNLGTELPFCNVITKVTWI
jgi:hypothetical protein